MESIISEEDLLSGVEVLPTTEPNTPSNAYKPLIGLNQSCLNNESPTPSPKKGLMIQTPVKNPSEMQSFSEKALEVQKTLQNSLTDSLRKEVEMKSKWQASPGEIFVNSTSKHNVLMNKNASAIHCNIPSKLNFLTMTDVDDQSLSTKNSELGPISVRPQNLSLQLSGPNVCLSTEFPSCLSPIKPCASEKDDESTLLELSPEKKIFGEDPSTKKLLEFIQKLEKDAVNDVTLAERMSQLSFMLKNNSINSGAKSDSEEACVDKQIESTIHQKNVLKTEAVKDNQTPFLPVKNPKKSKNNNPKATTNKATSLKKSDSLPYSKNNKMKPSSKTAQPSTFQRSVHFAQLNKQDRKKHEVKASVKNRRTKDVVNVPNSTSVLEQESISIEAKPTEASLSEPVLELNSVRNQLQNMLNLHKVDPIALDMTVYTNPQISGHDTKDDDTFRNSDTISLPRVQPSDLASLSPSKENAVEMTDSLTTELFTILKSNKQPHSARSSIDSSVAAEVAVLRDTLEKETYRRRHCEKQIQKLQKKVLDIQQELAVAHSTERKKDLMIEQLDNTLAKVVAGWKAHEANLVKTVGDLTFEKEKHREEIVKLKEMVVNFENELAKTLEELVEEKERVLRLEQNDKTIRSSYQARAEEIAQVIDQKNEHAQKLQKKIDQQKSEKRELQDKIEELSQIAQDEKNFYKQKETQWEEAVIDIEKRQKDLLQKEKELTEQERKRCQTIQSALSSTEKEVTRLQSLLESQRSEVESMHTQVAVLEAKHRADLQKLEAEHKINVERQVMEKLTQVHEESLANETRIRDSHKKQMLDLINSHKKELEEQCRRYEDELQKRDESMRRTMADQEMALNQKLKKKSEDMRSQMLSKMQNLLQSHYNETLQIVGSTTGVTPQRAPMTSKDINLQFSTDPTTLFRTSLVVPRESASNVTTGSSGTKWTDQFPVIKPVPTLPSSYQGVSAFPIATSTQPPLTSCFQPLTIPSSGYQLPERKTDDTVPSASTADDIEDGLTNLSLISSISHGPTTSLHHSQSHRGTLNENQVVNVEDQTNQTEIIGKRSYGIKTPTSFSAVELRQAHLQHYVQMLLQRSPGEPLDTSNQSLKSNGQNNKEEDKENASVDKQHLATLQPSQTMANAIVPLINQSENANSNLLPVKQQKKVFAAEAKESISKSLALEKKKLSGVEDVKKMRQNVRFSQDVTKANSMYPSQTSLVDTMPSDLHFLNPAQMGEISQILDLYSTVDTPTGETRLAAEHLLRYLRDTNSSATSKSSVQPSVTSSPLKKTCKQLTTKSSEAHVAPSSGKSRIKVGISPAKPAPVWR